MEPQNNYTSNYSGMQQQLYGRKKSKKGCLIIGLIIIFTLVAGSVIIGYFIYKKQIARWSRSQINLRTWVIGIKLLAREMKTAGLPAHSLMRLQYP